MVLIRRFEETVERLFSQGAVKGTTHPSTGQEAVPVGVCAALGTDDVITSNPRGHGHFLARGGDPNRIEFKKYCPRCRQHTMHRETR